MSVKVPIVNTFEDNINKQLKFRSNLRMPRLLLNYHPCGQYGISHLMLIFDI